MGSVTLDFFITQSPARRGIPAHKAVTIPAMPSIMQNARKHKYLIRPNLDLDCAVHSLLLLCGSGIRLGTHDTTTPLSLALLVLVGVSVLDGLDELGKLRLVL
jgi:hypothetical protein